MPKRKTTRKRRRNSPSISFYVVTSLCVTISIVACAVSMKKAEAPKERIEKVYVPEFDKVSIPVPASRLSRGVKIRDISLKNVSFPAHQVPEGAIRDITPYLEAVTLSALPANLPLFKENLSLTASVTNPVIDKIPDGMRAITVRVDATSAVEGWAAANTIVDVILITKKGTQLVAEKVRILSSERNVEPTPGSPEVPSTVTLLTSQEQALSISSATNLGRISFLLRGNSDEGVWRTTTFKAETLERNYSPERATSKVGGYLKVNGKEGYALLNGKWIKASAKPEGFLVNGAEWEK